MWEETSPQTIKVGAFFPQGEARIVNMWGTSTFCICADEKIAQLLTKELNKLSDKTKVKLVE